MLAVQKVMSSSRGFIVFFLLVIRINLCSLVPWERLRCAPDSQQEMPEGIVDDIGRFPWLGIVQHSFYLAGRTHFAVTGAVLIHPAFAIAPAEDIAKINPEELTNNTKLILWSNKNEKYALDVKDYILHPQYKNRVTFATMALLDLVAWRLNEMSEWQGSGNIEKEIFKMSFVNEQSCEEFYYKAKLTYKKMNPVSPICAVSKMAKKPCVWDGGTALITRQSWGHWKLIGFAVRGPGCGAPTKFLNIHEYFPWITDVISDIPLEDYKDMYKLVLRRVSPVKLIMYNAGQTIPKSHGQCDKNKRGVILYRDSSEILINKVFAQGFFYVTIDQVAEFLCAEVSLEASQRTNAAIWLEHNYHRDQMGSCTGAPGSVGSKLDDRRRACFLYFKTTAYIEFRFQFSFKASIEVAVYGREVSRESPDPFPTSQHTTNWWPTPNKLRLTHFTPVNTWWYNL